ncbi:MAG: efflux RND transporter permease subunit [Alphaproteobacteria bacterium]
MSRFFIDRPIFAGVISVVITLIGIFSLQFLPLAQYPEIAPPTVAVTAVFPGASAETMAETVAAPLEQEINGVENMLYLSSSNTADGLTTITVTFRPGTDLDQAQVLVQNRVKLAEPRLPADTRQIGVTVDKQSTNFLMIAALTSPDKSLDIDYMGNYGQSVLRDRLLRIPGVGAVQVFGGGNYSMRIWINPDLASARNLTATEIVNALQAQNVQVAGGALGRTPQGAAPPAFDAPLQVEGRLRTPEEFADAVIKTDADGRITRLRDVARVELGAQDYSLRGYFSGVRGVGIAVIQQPGSNALATAEAVLKEFKAASAQFPKGMTYSIPYNPTEYVAQSVDAVEHTLLEAIVLVVIVVLVFLQTWRAAIVPIIAIPVALVGVFTIQLALRLFAEFAIALRSCARRGHRGRRRHCRGGKALSDTFASAKSPREAAYKTMEEVSGPLIAIGAVLISVFVPTALTPGIPGAFLPRIRRRHFGRVDDFSDRLADPVASAGRAVVETASRATTHRKLPGLAAPRRQGGPHVQSRVREPLSSRYGRFTAVTVRKTGVLVIIYVVLIAITGWRLGATPTGFIPQQDQGYLIGVIQLPPGSSLDRTDKALAQVNDIARKTRGVDLTVAFAGLDGASFLERIEFGGDVRRARRLQKAARPSRAVR